ncbi:zinc finger and SCAN domain-containing protein 31-like isoform X34 [Maniola hyperantus]|uniref:zinc finger and SCAN domain-containing protein 31-like isoform X34 n=1 Tax=Aphantopus hyperantus TaxID=2795564 RepID=UPI003747A378
MATKTWKIEKDLCRCCHGEGAFNNLAEPRTFLDKVEVYSDMLRECLDIDIPPVPGELCAITYTICNACIARLRDACNFKKQVQDCEQRFMTLYYKNAIQGLKPATKVKEEIEVSIEHAQSDTDADIVLKKEDEDDDDDNHFLGGDDDDGMSDDDLPIKPPKQSVSTMKTRPKPKPKPKAPPVVKKLKPPPKPKKAEPKPAKEKKEPKYTVVDGKFVCDVCQKRKDTYKQLHEHWKCCHTDGHNRNRCCKFCSLTMDRRKLAFHLEDLHNVPAPRCGVCDRRFPSENEKLKHHRRAHMKEKTLVCRTCDRAFFALDGLKKHMKVHTKEKLFECDVCGKTFRWRTNFEYHFMIHTNDKRKKCSLCNAAFVQKASLDYHMLRRHPEAH